MGRDGRLGVELLPGLAEGVGLLPLWQRFCAGGGGDLEAFLLGLPLRLPGISLGMLVVQCGSGAGPEAATLGDVGSCINNASHDTPNAARTQVLPPPLS